jgi:hypothetical protein
MLDKINVFISDIKAAFKRHVLPDKSSKTTAEEEIKRKVKLYRDNIDSCKSLSDYKAVQASLYREMLSSKDLEERILKEIDSSNDKMLKEAVVLITKYYKEIEALFIRVRNIVEKMDKDRDKEKDDKKDDQHKKS